MNEPPWEGREAIVFDGEGVVIDSEPIWDKSQTEFLKRRGIPYDRERLKPLLAGRSMREGARLLQKEFGFSGEPSALAAERVDIVRDVFQREADFVPGFLAFYQRVRHRFKTCIATVMPHELLTLVIEKLRLRDLFSDHIYSPDVHGLPSKPAPDLFLFAAERLRVLPERCVVIEDSPNGIIAAKRAHMYVVGIATTFKKTALREADLVVSSFEEIVPPDS